MPKSKRKRKTSQDSNKDVRTIIIKAITGSLLGIICYFVLTIIMSFIALKMDMNSTGFKYIVIVICGISGMVCGFTAVRPIRQKGIAIGALSSLPAFLLIIVVSSLVSRTGMEITGWISLAVMFVFSAVGGVLAVNKRK